MSLVWHLPQAYSMTSVVYRDATHAVPELLRSVTTVHLLIGWFLGGRECDVLPTVLFTRRNNNVLIYNSFDVFHLIEHTP
ncbi:hypothetical protein [Thermosporothrix hazakensis]|uniref:hypothetical protein n=1 Tax=Thermosporothrix hazakensis TaxID=644383 RepID=UPI000DAEBC6C|nr:hypothetical protein [Thermosporothrix hazakensis]